jgi:hypothetical protein
MRPGWRAGPDHSRHGKPRSTRHPNATRRGSCHPTGAYGIAAHGPTRIHHVLARLAVPQRQAAAAAGSGRGGAGRGGAGRGAFVTQMPTRSPCVAQSTGLRNICRGASHRPGRCTATAVRAQCAPRDCLATEIDDDDPDVSVRCFGALLRFCGRRASAARRCECLSLARERASVRESGSVRRLSAEAPRAPKCGRRCGGARHRSYSCYVAWRGAACIDLTFFSTFRSGSSRL